MVCAFCCGMDLFNDVFAGFSDACMKACLQARAWEMVSDL
jgi:hypothetical protein